MKTAPRIPSNASSGARSLASWLLIALWALPAAGQTSQPRRALGGGHRAQSQATSAPSSRPATGPSRPHRPESRPAGTTRLGEPGALLRLYDIEEPMAALPELRPNQHPNAVRVIRTLDLKSGDFQPLSDGFYSEVLAFIEIRKSGTYAFRLTSDDGSRLEIDEKVVVDNDGTHAPQPKEGAVRLAMGFHSLRITHFDSGGGEQLTLEWKRPAGKLEASFTPVPVDVLRVPADASRATAAGRKRIIPPLRRGLPGDGTALAAVHPAFVTEPQPYDVLSKLTTPEKTPPIDESRIRVMGARPAGRRAPEPSTPALWLPPGAGAREVACVSYLPQTSVYKGQVAICDGGPDGLWRGYLEQVGSTWQGCVLRFCNGFDGPVSSLMCGPDGLLYLTVRSTPPAGSREPGAPPIRGEPPKNQIMRLAPSGKSAFEMLAVHAMSNGFEIEFTEPLDPRVGWDAESFHLESWRCEPKVQRGLPQRDGTTLPVRSASVSPDRQRVFVEVGDLQPQRVVYLRLTPPWVSESGRTLWATEAWYTLTEIPQDRAGTVLSRPPAEPQNVLSDAERAEGWRLLFDGRTTTGWHLYRKVGAAVVGWEVKDGSLVRTGPGGDLSTDAEFQDFELKLEWRISPAGNSGIMFRVNEAYDYPWQTGPEMQVLDNAEHADGRDAKTSAGSNYALIAPPGDLTRPVGLYNEARILVRGRHVEHWLNGTKALEYELLSPDWEQRVKESKFVRMPHYGREPKGRIVLQDHGDRVWYRNIKIRELR